MKLDDIIALAKQGYKPSDIKELMSLATDNVTEPEVKEEESLEVEKTQTEEEPPVVEDEKPDERDIKIAELEKKLATAQKQNRNKDISANQKSDEEIFESFVKSFV